ncbi:MAG TPA: hydantoinase B/oxoprolinase family protein [Candidatus Micrarchaeia archaeon]|nr:hydantoinase B/oxoprolinase family protein [Candidatus Micrarchaeia archaeon]
MNAGRRALDPITFELIHQGLLAAAEEMGGVLKRSSYSPIIRDMEDFSCALFAANGALVAQADYIPAQLGAMSLVVGSIRQRWAGSITEGDVFLANHPYLGGMHTPDLNVIAPVFRGGGLVAWAGTTAHHLDVGGVNPGTEGPDLGEVFAEGLLLAPVRLVRAGAENRDVFEIVGANVRDPLSTLSDLRGQRAACELGGRRVLELVERHGLRQVRAAFADALRLSERATRAALRDLPDGIGRAEGFCDDDGRGGPPTRIHAAVTKEGEGLLVDLSGSAGQVAGALNVPWASTRAAVVYAVRAMTRPDAAVNDGLLHAVEIVCPSGCVLNPDFPAAVSVRHNTCQRLADTLIRAMAAIWPDRAVGSSTVAFFAVNIGSRAPADGRRSVLADVVGGGAGAHPGGDGLDGVDTYLSNVGLMPVEVAESGYEVRILRTELIPGSQGRGRFQGGLGLRRDYQVVGRPQTVTYYAEQTNPAFAPRGAAGGGDAGPTRLVRVEADGREVSIPTKGTLTLAAGAILRVETSGGGGYGPPGRRSLIQRRRDVEDGRVPAPRQPRPPRRTR